MRVVLDTNILVSSQLAETGLPASIYSSKRKGNFTLLTCAEQLTELRQTLSARIKPYKAGRLVNELKEFAEVVGSLARVKRSPDPTDDFLLALTEAGRADYLVTGDKSGLLTLALTGPYALFPLTAAAKLPIRSEMVEPSLAMVTNNSPAALTAIGHRRIIQSVELRSAVHSHRAASAPHIRDGL